MHFRHGCNRSWELSGMNPVVLRQQMGHSSAVMTADTPEKFHSNKYGRPFPAWNWKIWKMAGLCE